MNKNIDNSVFSRCFNHNLTKEDVSSLNKDELLSIFIPSSFDNDIHNTNRVLAMEAIKDILIRYHNLNESASGVYIILRDSIYPAPKFSNNGRRYQFHGGKFGIFDGYFNSPDRFFRIKSSNGSIEGVDSIPNWNIAHFFCDYLNTDDKTRDMIDWVFENDFWNDMIRFQIIQNFVSVENLNNGERDDGKITN